ncbi:MAG: hypothetical protein HY720_05800 [Planctomycetes bacterium]|nr:hypothetical protein [Planctomycetota bacterium]
MRQEIGRLKRICIRGFLALTVLLALVAAFPGVLLLRAHGEPADREIVVGSVVALGALAAVWLGVPWMLFARVARFRRLWRFGIRVEAEVEFCELTTRYSGLPLSRSHSATVLFEYEGRAYRRSFGGLEQAYPEAVYCVRQGRVQTNRGFVLVDAKKPARSILVPAAAWREAAK